MYCLHKAFSGQVGADKISWNMCVSSCIIEFHVENIFPNEGEHEHENSQQLLLTLDFEGFLFPHLLKNTKN